MLAGFNTTANGIVSAQSVLDCGGGYAYPGDACDGGYISRSLTLSRWGLGTCSSDTQCASGCIPYCAPDGCTDSQYCPNTCRPGSNSTTGAIAYGTKAYWLSTYTKDAIKKEIYTNGPVAAGFNVYESWIDFCYYTPTEVYGPQQYVQDSLLGGHAVVVVGWGQDAGGDYWIVQNSWSPWWGDNGFFYVRAGYNLMYLESNLYGSLYSSVANKRMTEKKRRDLDEADDKPELLVGASTALDPASPQVQSLGLQIGNQFATKSNPAFQFASMQSATSQVVGGISYKATVAGTDGTLVEATILRKLGKDASQQVLSMSVVGQVTPLPADLLVSPGDPSTLSQAAANGHPGHGEGGGGGAADAAATGLSGGAIAGAVVGSVLGAIFIVSVVVGVSYEVYRRFFASASNETPAVQQQQQQQQQQRQSSQKQEVPITSCMVEVNLNPFDNSSLGPQMVSVNGPPVKNSTLLDSTLINLCGEGSDPKQTEAADGEVNVSAAAAAMRMKKEKSSFGSSDLAPIRDRFPLSLFFSSSKS